MDLTELFGIDVQECIWRLALCHTSKSRWPRPAGARRTRFLPST
jgi:hypothetical protein